MPVLGIRGAAISTVISQAVSAIFVISFLRKCHAKEEIYLQGISFAELKKSGKDIANVLGLGASAFIMQVTNSLVQMACNAVLSRTGGDLYISVMTIVASVRRCWRCQCWLLPREPPQSFLIIMERRILGI